MHAQVVERIHKDLPILEGARSLNDLAEFLANSLRPYTLTTPPTTIHVNIDTGDDELGDGTSGNPLADLPRAFQFIQERNVVNCNIQLHGVGPYTHPGLTVLSSFVTVLGEETIEDSRTVSLSSVTAGKGVTFTVSGGALSNDAWRDRHLTLTGLFSNTRGFIVSGNTGNVIRGHMHNRTLTSDVQSNPNTGTVNLISYTQITVPTTCAFLSCFQLNYRKVKFTGDGSTMFFQATDKVDFRYCEFEILLISVGRGGGAFVLSSSIANIGNANGMAQVRSKGDMRLGYGTVVSGRRASANNAFIQVFENSILIREGLVWNNELDAKGYNFQGGHAQIIAPSATITGHMWFDDSAADAASSSCLGTVTINEQGTGTGGDLNFGQLMGKANTNDSIKATAGARATMSGSSSLLTLHGTNTVSADNGTSICSEAADGTLIVGGVPANPNINAFIQTTNATPAPIFAFSIPTGFTAIVTVDVVAVRTGGSSGSAGDSSMYTLRGAFRNVGGTLTMEANDYVVHFESQAGTDAVLDVSGTTARAVWTGAANNNFNVRAKGRVTLVSS